MPRVLYNKRGTIWQVNKVWCGFFRRRILLANTWYVIQLLLPARQAMRTGPPGGHPFGRVSLTVLKYKWQQKTNKTPPNMIDCSALNRCSYIHSPLF